MTRFRKINETILKAIVDDQKRESIRPMVDTINRAVILKNQTEQMPLQVDIAKQENDRLDRIIENTTRNPVQEDLNQDNLVLKLNQLVVDPLAQNIIKTIKNSTTKPQKPPKPLSSPDPQKPPKLMLEVKEEPEIEFKIPGSPLDKKNKADLLKIASELKIEGIIDSATKSNILKKIKEKRNELLRIPNPAKKVLGKGIATGKIGAYNLAKSMGYDGPYTGVTTAKLTKWLADETAKKQEHAKASVMSGNDSEEGLALMANQLVEIVNKGKISDSNELKTFTDICNALLSNKMLTMTSYKKMCKKLDVTP